ncbi:MAG: thioredoxin [Candidatus Cloacimonadaceae bacterium]|jgi:thioredoxin 1|nr:thioredoxin [Candidatus Cloacimonadota bacterium]MDD3523875.1 thioredoxin [Candidatus Cloacimonadota bacterium]MDY0319415.1 thioredoxin [Candidatus Cloacimonadaceae bacterium]HQB98130.1 thioredoxin [Candidatus Cloacimonadota bacterium]
MLIEVTDKNFAEVIKQGNVIIDFWAPWCGPCNMIGPILEEMANEMPDITFGKLNVDDYPELAGKHGVMSIPTLFFYRDGELRDSSIGAVSKNVIINKLKSLD